MSLRSLVFRPVSAREPQLWPEPSPNQNVHVTDLPGERSPVSAVRKAHEAVEKLGHMAEFFSFGMP
jgi:hypothetical protein